MDSGKFLSKASVFSGDCSCDLHNRENEPARCLHYHDFYEFFVYLGRTGLFVIDGREYPVSRGDIVIVNMFTPHMMIPDDERQDECFVAHINPELLIAYGTSKSNLLDIFQKSENFTPVYSLGKEAFAKYRNLMNEYRTVHLKNGHDILDKAIIHLLLAYAYSDFFSGIHCDDTVSHNLTVVTQIINYINEHLTEKISLPMLVKEVHYSKS